MRVLVTGGAGFIGSSLVHSLAGAGDAVGVIDDLSTGKAGNLHPLVWFRPMDILDDRLADAVGDFSPEVVVHLAAQADVQASIADPDRDWAVNVEGTRAVAKAAAACGARRVISASSAAVYGEPAEVPLLESSAKAPANPYGRSKLAAETSLAEALGQTGTDFASFRFSNVYGPRQDWRGEGGVVAIFAARLAFGGHPVVFGTGRQTRDFIFVGDIVTAIEAAAAHDGPLAAELPDGPAYNIATGREHSVEEIAALLRAEAGAETQIEHRPAREGDVVRSALDPSKARAAFGWQARQPLATGLAVTWQWFRATS